MAVDAHDHVWVVQRPKSLTEDERGAALVPPRGNIYTTEVASGKRAQRFVYKGTAPTAETGVSLPPS